MSHTRCNRACATTLLATSIATAQASDGLPDLLTPLAGFPYFVRAVDLDLDGDRDLAVFNSGSLQVLRGDGQGNFAAPVGYPADGFVTQMALDDFNADLLPDVVIGSTQGRVVVLLNIGNAVFAAPVQLPIGGAGTVYGKEVHNLATVDVEHDGDIDLVVAARDYLAVFLGHGNGTFASPTLYQFGGDLPSLFAAGDFNDDGYADVARSGASGPQVMFFVNDTVGGFLPPTSLTFPSYPTSLLLCDVNGDTHGDFVWTPSISPAPVRVQFGDGTGNFGTPVDTVVYSDGLPWGARPIRPLDFDGDGVLDLLAASRALTWLRGAGNGSFVAQTYVLGAGGFSSGDCADLNGDGRLDLVGVGASSNSLRVALADCFGSFPGHARFATGLLGPYTQPTAIDVGDLNGDGNLDAVCGMDDVGSTWLSVFLGDGLGGLAAPVLAPVGTSMNALALGDLTGDGVLDVVLTNDSVGSVDVFAGNGAGGFSLHSSASSNTHLVDVAIAELDGNPGVDVVVADRLTPRIAVYPNAGGGALGPMIALSLTGVRRPTCLAVGQVDGLAGLDVVVGYVHNMATGPTGLAVLLGDGAGGFTLQLNDFVSAITDVALGDLDGDGKLDAIATDSNSGAVRAFRQFSNGAWTLTSNTALSDNLGNVALGDIDGNGTVDVAVSTRQKGLLAVLLGDGAGGLGAPILHARDFQGFQGSRLVIADIDHDLRGDVLVCNDNSDTLSVYTHASAPGQAVAYCVAATNSLGCVPSIGGIGIPSATSASPFSVGASNVLNQKNGFLMYGFGAADNPLTNGLKCIGGPTRRTTVQSSGGSPSGSDCSGHFALDFNAYVQSGVDPLLVPGVEVFAQYWSRDPSATPKLSVTDGLRFTLCP